MSVLQQFKCPCCDGAIEFDSAVQKMKCPYCDTEFEMEAIQPQEDQADEMTWDTAAGSEWQPGETEGLRVYTCNTRGGSIGFADVPMDGSTKMDDSLMESIEPFDLSAAVDFQTAYLSGYLADKYDVDAEESVHRANERIRRSTEEAFAATVQGYATVTPTATSIRLHNGRARYALLPVWILNTQWNGQKFTFAINGQTGKIVGDLPMDKGILNKWVYGVTGAVTAAVFALSYLLWLL